MRAVTRPPLLPLLRPLCALALLAGLALLPLAARAGEEPNDPNSPDNQTPKTKKRRRWPYVAGAIVALFLLLILLAPTIASMGAVRSLVVSKINNSLNGTLAINDWSIGWLSGVWIEGIKIDDQQGRRVVEVDSVRVPISLIGAARGNYDLGEVVIDKDRDEVILSDTSAWDDVDRIRLN